MICPRLQWLLQAQCFLGGKSLLSFLRIEFYSSILMASGLPIPNGLDIESQPVSACKKISCLDSLKSSANLFILHRLVPFSNSSVVKMRCTSFLVNEKANQYWNICVFSNNNSNLLLYRFWSFLNNTQVCIFLWQDNSTFPLKFGSKGFDEWIHVFSSH